VCSCVFTDSTCDFFNVVFALKTWHKCISMFTDGRCVFVKGIFVWFHDKGVVVCFLTVRVTVFPVLWFPVTTACRVFRLPMKERPPIRRVAADTLNEKLRTADEG